MFARILTVCLLVAAANAGAISVISGGIGGHGGLVGLGGPGGLGGLGGIGLGYGELGLNGGHGIAIAKQAVVDYHAPAQYEFKYGVEDAHTGDNKQQSEVRVGDTVKGQYSLAEPDGTIRVVKYTADPHNGFNAQVSRIGHAAHPQVVATHGLGLGLGHL